MQFGILYGIDELGKNQKKNQSINTNNFTQVTNLK